MPLRLRQTHERCHLCTRRTASHGRAADLEPALGEAALAGAAGSRRLGELCSDQRGRSLGPEEQRGIEQACATEATAGDGLHARGTSSIPTDPDGEGAPITSGEQRCILPAAH